VTTLEYTDISQSSDAIKIAEKPSYILREFASLFPDDYQCIANPSTILTIAGLRAQSPYNAPFKSDSDTRKAIRRYLQSYGIAVVDEEPVAGRSMTSMSIVNAEALKAVPARYPALQECWINPPVLSTYSFHAWSGATDMKIAAAIESGALPSLNLADWWTPHDVRFGACLGYPWPAISAFSRVEARMEPPSSLQYVRVAAAYEGSAEVGFMASTDPDGRRAAKETVELWRKVLGSIDKRSTTGQK
jgi:hypothetical protein